MPRKKLFVFAGPSGCGKTTIARAILNIHPEILFSVSATTRLKRDVEVNGRDYYFISKEQFEDKIQNDGLIEWEQIYGDYYGSLKSEVDKAFNAEQSLLFDVDVNGALSIKKKYPNDTVLIFIKPPSIESLRERLMDRKTETPETFTRRMERVAMELERADEFDYCVVNDDLCTAITVADSIVQRAL